MTRHFNPMAQGRESDGQDSSNDYIKHNLKVVEIRDRSIFIEINPMSTQPMGRSLLHAASDDRITNYRGELPMEFALSVQRWWLERYGFIRGD